MKTWIRVVLFLLLGGMVVETQIGCVRSSTYQKATKKLDDVWILYHGEQLRTQELRARNQQMKEQMAEFAATLQTWRNQLARTEQDYQEAREELVRIRKQERLSGREGITNAEFRRRFNEIKGAIRQVQALLEEQ